MSTLFQQIEREDISNRAELNKRQQLHLPFIGAFSRANDPYEMRSQLIGANGVASLGLENSQASELPEPFIRTQRGMFRPIRMDHTDFFKWLLKLIHSFA